AHSALIGRFRSTIAVGGLRSRYLHAPSVVIPWDSDDNSGPLGASFRDQSLLGNDVSDKSLTTNDLIDIDLIENLLRLLKVAKLSAHLSEKKLIPPFAGRFKVFFEFPQIPLLSVA